MRISDWSSDVCSSDLAKALPHLLGAEFVHGQGRSQNAAAGVGDIGAFQQSLHAAVFATTTMQDDEGTIDALVAQALQQVIAGIDAERIHTGLLHRGEYRRAGFKRSEESRVGKEVAVRVDLGGRRNIKKK